MLDADLAIIYGVSTKQLNQAVKRNQDRFPADFMFRLSAEEWAQLREQFAAATDQEEANAEQRSQTVTSTATPESDAADISDALAEVNWGSRRYAPYAFTEHGAIMLASVLRSERAVQASIQVVRAFVHIRSRLLQQEQIALRLEQLETAVEGNFNVVFEAINELMAERQQPRRMIGFKPEQFSEDE